MIMTSFLYFALGYFIFGFALIGNVLPLFLLSSLEEKFPPKGARKHTRFFRTHDYATALFSESLAQKKFGFPCQTLRSHTSSLTQTLTLIYLSAWYGFYFLLIPLLAVAYWKISGG